MVSIMANNYSFIGKYRLVEELASGAFGRVYRAEDTSMNNRIVAIKLMHTAHLASVQEHHSFLQEAQFLKMLNHPYILPVLDVGVMGTDEQIPYMVTEYAPNGSLLERLAKQSPRPLPYQEAMLILAQIGQALQYAHKLNIIHRDLKPANILFNANGDAVLADFGIATTLATSMKYGTAVGTPYYMAPEQFRGSISKEGDQYSLGCIAYELLTGRVPFTAPDFFALGYKHMSEKPIPPTQLNLLLPRTTEQAILKAMEKQRTDRHADIAAFLTALGVPSVPPASSAPSLPVPVRQHRVPVQPSLSSSSYSTMQAPKAKLVEEPGVIPTAGKAEKLPPPFVTTRLIEEPGVIPTAGKAEKPPPPALPTPRPVEEPGVIPTPDMASTMNLPLPPSTPVSMADSLPRVLETPQIPQTPYPPLADNQGLPQPGRRPFQHMEEVEAFIPLHVDQQSVAAYNGAIQSQMQLQVPAQGGYEVSAIHTPAPINGVPFIGQQRDNRKKARPRWLLVASAVLILVLLSGAGLTFAWSYLTGKHIASTPVVTPASAIVTITPAHNDLSVTYTLSAVPGKPNAALNQVQARLLSSVSPTQTKTVPATGNGSMPATHAKGTLTFWNDSTSSKSFSAGMVFTDSKGIQVVNDARGTLPAGNPITPIWTSVTVPAHVNQVGPSGNISRVDINSWTSYGNGYFVVQNDSAFSGGQNVQPYTYVQNSDFMNIADFANGMKSNLLASAQAEINTQVGTGETLINGVQCVPGISYNHKVGDHATSITTTVVVSCSAEVYNQQAAREMATNLLKRRIITAPSTSYTLTNTITTTVLQARISDAQGTITLLLKADSIGMFQFSDAQKHALAALIVGKSERDAQTILLHQTGINQVVISLSSGNGHTLPADFHRITITVLLV